MEVTIVEHRGRGSESVALLIGILVAIVACGGTGAPPVDAALPSLVPLPSCLSDEAAPVGPHTPSLVKILAATPEWAEAEAGPDPDVSVRIERRILPIAQGTGANLPKSLFEGAQAHTPAGDEVPLLVVKVVGDSGTDALVRRRALIDVKLGDQLVTLRPNDGGTFVTYASLPGVAMTKGDAVGVTIRGKGLLEEATTAKFEGRWTGEWPFVLGDDAAGLEIRALPAAAIEPLLPSLAKSIDAGIADRCVWSLLKTDRVSFWSPLDGAGRAALKEYAALSGWDDPRLQVRLDRIERVKSEWRAELATLSSEVAVTTPAFGTPTKVGSRTLTVSGVPRCEVSGLGVRCRSAVYITGDRPLDAKDVFETGVLHADGTTHPIRLQDNDKDGTLVLEWSPAQAPAAGEVVLYRPDDAEAWVHLQ